MKKMIVIGFCLVAISQVFSEEKELVARQDYEVSKDWQPPQIMGKDFWFLLQNDYRRPEFFVDSGKPEMRELEEKPVFKESGVLYWNNSITVPGYNKVSISAMSPAAFLKLVEKRPHSPFFFMPSSVRPPQKLMKAFEHDMETYTTWKHTHPNFMGWINAETDNDFLRALPWRKSADLWKLIGAADDKELIETIVREFPKPQSREEITLQFLKGCEANRKYFFNDTGKVNYLRASYCFDHYFYESGADAATLETTNTGGGEEGTHYRHQVSLFFTRGAAHQYNKKWMWYIAAYYNGYDDHGKFGGNNLANYRLENEKPSSAGGYYGPECGMSPSLYIRDMFLAYLNGPSFVCAEEWWNFLRQSKKDGKSMWDLSTPYGKGWEDWFEFTRKNPDRGTSYAPVALLVPFTQGYPNYGGKSWGIFDYERPDWMIDAFMYTIVPRSPVTKKGDEGALANSPFGDIYDVLTPDTPQKPVSIEVLNNYKVAVMLGKYAKDKALSEQTMEYVKNGGTLLLNINQINEFFPSAFLGFERTDIPDNIRDRHAVKVKGPVRSLSEGTSFELFEEYEMKAVKLKGATPLLEDARGNVLACQNRYGKGNVIVATVDYLLPKTNNVEWPGGVYGKTFPFVEYFLRSFVKEVLPLEVKGDIEYGLNKLDDAWLLYLINNKGVTKFTNKDQTLDMSKTANVEVFLRNIKAAAITELRGQTSIQKDGKANSFTVAVTPGDVKVFKITR